MYIVTLVLLVNMSYMNDPILIMLLVEMTTEGGGILCLSKSMSVSVSV